MERSRDYFGMDGGNLLAVVREAKEMVKLLGLAPAATRDWSVPVFIWLTRPTFRWGIFRTPTLRSVKDLLRTDERLQRYPEVVEIMNLSRAAFGRDNFWDQVTKVARVASTTTVPVDYAARWIYVHMLRKNKKDPFADRDLLGLGGKFAQIAFHAVHLSYLVKTYPIVLEVPASVSDANRPAALAKMELLTQCILNPRKNYQTFEVEGQNTLLMTIPEATRLLVQHAIDLRNDFYCPEIKGISAAAPDSGCWSCGIDIP